MGSANSNIVSITIPSTSAKDSVQAAGDFLAGLAAAFLPPTAPALEDIQSGGDFVSGSFTSVDPFFADVVLLVPFDGANNATSAPDLSPVGNTMTFHGPAALTTTNPKFGSASLGGTGFESYVSAPSPASSPLDLSTGDFTVEGWLLTFPGGGNGEFIAADTGASGFVIRLATADATVGVVFGSIGTTITHPNNLVASAWNAIAFVRQGNVYDLFLNGVASGLPKTLAGSMGVGPNFAIGYDPVTGGSGSVGQIDEVRVTKGVCRYPPGVNYTPAVAAFPTS